MPKKNEDALENPNRRKIVEVARWLFYERGYGPTSLGDLARESGIPKGNFYYHFRSKDDVLRAVVQARLADVQKQLDDWGASLGTPRQRLLRLVDMLVNEEEKLVQYGCPMGSLLTELGKAQRELQEEAFAVLEAIIAFAAEEFRTTGASASLSRDRAVHLIGRCQGAVVMAQGLRSAAVLRKETKAIRGWLEETLNPRGVESSRGGRGRESKGEE